MSNYNRNYPGQSSNYPGYDGDYQGYDESSNYQGFNETSNYQGFDGSSGYQGYYSNEDGIQNGQNYGRSGYTWYNPQFYGQDQQLDPSFVLPNSQCNEPNDYEKDSTFYSRQYEPQPGPSRSGSLNYPSRSKTYSSNTSRNEGSSRNKSYTPNSSRNSSRNQDSANNSSRDQLCTSNSSRNNDVANNSSRNYDSANNSSRSDSSANYPSRNETDRNPRETGRTGGRRQAPGSGANRLYRNPNAYYGTTQHPHTTYNRSDNQDRSTNSQGDSKTEDRRKLLAEVATLLNQEQSVDQNVSNQRASQNQDQNMSNQRPRQVKTAFTTRPDYDKNKEKNKGWSAQPNDKFYQDKFKKDLRRSDNERKTSDRREPENQRERLVQQLSRGKLDCLVCCERLRHSSAVWSCENCYHVLHLHCISKWALTSTSKQMDGIKLRQETKWRCPACQHQYDSIPDRYTCFCTRYTNPRFIKGETPHCCGEVCCKVRTCGHPCTLLCHPGPCPPCNATVQRECGCGRTQQSVKCSSTVLLECELLCARMLDCGKHDCLQKCHQGDCQPCHNTLQQVCHCGKESRQVSCGSEPNFSCGTVCGKGLECGKHECTMPCHAGACGKCPFDPVSFTTCHCGAKQIIRESCLDPVESCGNKCSIKRAACTHDCPEICHSGKCPPCSVVMTCQCRCGHNSSVKTTCHDLNTLGQKPMCKKKCSKKRACAKHKCNQECCNDLVHECLLPCNKTLSCGQHKCQQLCHRGNCLPCTRLGFEELRCHCGYSVIYPPIDCGTRPPECTQPCTRNHDCEHVPTHVCHSLPECPPCTVLVSRTCYGGHETRKAVFCYIAQYSCGLPCGKELPCHHRCSERCHGGPCPAVCKQPCTTPRDACSHPCSLPCHKGTPCSGQSPCTSQLEISCQCQRRKQTTTCNEFRRTWFRYQAAALQANKDQVIDPTKINTKVLECDEECKLYERNLRLAIGLQIANPDLSNKLKPQYSEMMKQWAKKDPRFADMVHAKLTQLVQLAKESKQKSRSYSFDIMSSTKRAFVHEYCKHFGCESIAYDAEPKRNVVATAYRDKCWLPSYSLIEIVQRENGQRKVPLPTLRNQTGDKNVSVSRESRESMIPLSKPSSASQSNPWARTAQTAPPRPPSPHIDYFDFTPTSS